MDNTDKAPEGELQHGYTPKVEEGYKPKPVTATATHPPKPPAGSGASSHQEPKS